MAFVLRGQSRCSICDTVLGANDEVIGLLHVLPKGHPLWRFSDSATHRECFEQWPYRRYFEALCEKHQQLLHSRPTGYVDADEWSRYASKQMQDAMASLDHEHFGILTRDGDLAIRLMRDADADYTLVSSWLTDPRVLEFYEGRDSPQSLDDVRTGFNPRLMALQLETLCIIEWENTPIGYIQFYPTNASGTWGLDQFIGIPEHWNQGLGTRVVRLITAFLFESKGAITCQMDPRASNYRAIRCYEKAGYVKAKLLERHELHEGEFRDCWLMHATPTL